MKKLFLTFCTCLLFIYCYGQNFNLVNQHHYGTSNADQLNNFIKCQDGGFLVLSTSNGGDIDKASPSFGGNDAWIIRLNPDFSIRWEKTFGGNLDENPVSVQELPNGQIMLLIESGSSISGNKLTAGYGNKDYWLLKLDNQGNKIWEKTYGSSAKDSPSCILALGNNKFVLIGDSSGGISGNKSAPSYGFIDIWVILVDSTGTEIWQKSYGGVDADESIGFEHFVLQNGNFVIISNSDSSVSGIKTTTPFGLMDAWILEIDATNGQISHQVSIGGVNDDYLISGIENNSSLILVGFSNSDVSGNKTSDLKGLRDAWKVKLDASLNILSDESYGGTAYSGFGNIEKTTSGYIVTGSAQNDSNPMATGSINGNQDGWIVGFDNSDNYQWNYLFGVNEINEYIYNLIELGHNNYVFSYCANTSGMNGDLTQTNYGNYDLYLIELSTDLSLNSLSESSIQVFPVPSDGKVNFNIKGINEPTQLCIFSQEGKLIDLISIPFSGSIISWETNIAGVYYYSINNRKGKFIVK